MKEISMKKILLSLALIISTNFCAMQKPQSKNDCFVSYLKYKSLVQACADFSPYAIERGCVDRFLQQFLQECEQEATRKKATKNK